MMELQRRVRCVIRRRKWKQREEETGLTLSPSQHNPEAPGGKLAKLLLYPVSPGQMEHTGNHTEPRSIDMSTVNLISPVSAAANTWTARNKDT